MFLEPTVKKILSRFSAVIAFVLLATVALADDPKVRELVLSDGQITLTAPEAWKKQMPRTKIVDFEFSAPASKDDGADGRLTVMGAGGSVEQNIERWMSQFPKLDKANGERVKKIKVGDQEVTLVDLAGTFKDQRGPFAPAEMKENYRMLGAIVATPKAGQYFLKFYGPKQTISDHEKAFLDMLNTLKVK